jgi:hypothetical protein
MMTRRTKRFESAVQMGSCTVEQHLRALHDHTKRTGKNPIMQEVLMTETPTGTAAGEFRVKSLLQPSPIAVLSHPFGPELKSWEHEVDVDCVPD